MKFNGNFMIFNNKIKHKFKRFMKEIKFKKSIRILNKYYKIMVFML